MIDLLRNFLFKLRGWAVWMEKVILKSFTRYNNIYEFGCSRTADDCTANSQSEIIGKSDVC